MVDAVVIANGTLNALAVAEVVIVEFVEFVAVVAVPVNAAVIVPALKLPEASRATMVDAPLIEAAVVRAFANVPVDILEAFSVVTLAPLPFKVPIKFVADTLAAVKLPEASRATIVLAPLAEAAVV